MLRKLCLVASLLFFCTFSAFGYLDYDDGIDVMDIRPVGSGLHIWSWTRYDTLADCLATVTLRPGQRKKGYEDRGYAGNVVISFSKTVFNSVRKLEPEIWVSVLTSGESPSPVIIRWYYIRYGHVHFQHYPDHLLNSNSHPYDYHDFISLLSESEYLNTTNPHESPILIEVSKRIQSYVDRGRADLGYDIAPPGPIPAWQTGVALKAGDWIQHGKNYDYWIARIDISAANNTITPNVSAAFRSQSRKRFQPEWDADDITKTMTIDTDIFLSYSTNVVLLQLPRAIYDYVPRFGYISLELNSKWLIAKILDRMYNDNIQTMLLHFDPYEKKGEMNIGDTVRVKLQQVIPAPTE